MYVGARDFGSLWGESDRIGKAAQTAWNAARNRHKDSTSLDLADGLEHLADAVAPLLDMLDGIRCAVLTAAAAVQGKAPDQPAAAGQFLVMEHDDEGRDNAYDVTPLSLEDAASLYADLSANPGSSTFWLAAVTRVE